MNITLTIPDKHVPELLAVIAILLAETQLEQAHDTTPDHPELALDDESEELAESRPESAENDPTMRELPWDLSWPKPPQLPIGKTKWVYRGTFNDKRISADTRDVFYLHNHGWGRDSSFSGPNHHIEAV